MAIELGCLGVDYYVLGLTFRHRVLHLRHGHRHHPGHDLSTSPTASGSSARSWTRIQTRGKCGRGVRVHHKPDALGPRPGARGAVRSTARRGDTPAAPPGRPRPPAPPTPAPTPHPPTTTSAARPRGTRRVPRPGRQRSRPPGGP
ncbi:hypothetical protein QJS66_08240 [Kocuria rhizophila]|nr:hypothetical protein QJS66_08240 [Kocuria rhizophila]